ncbi:MAG: hypothetical protein LBD04_01600 [Synergistaceae bacterium]|jgi:hypothetical protein|nr:hypothetical protein [Synergistaceae bacterium]
MKIATSPISGVRFVFFGFLPHIYIHAKIPFMVYQPWTRLKYTLRSKKQMRTYVFKLYRSKRNKHIHREFNLAGSIYNHLIAPRRRYCRLFGKGIDVAHSRRHRTKFEEDQTL